MKDPGSRIRRLPVIVAWILIFLVLYVFAYPILIELMDRFGLFESIPEPARSLFEASFAPLGWLAEFPPYESYISWILDLIY